MFTLPGSTKPLEVHAEFAWEGNGKQVGLRFQDPSLEVTQPVAGMAGAEFSGVEKDDPPVALPAYGFEFGWLLPRDQFAVPGFDARNACRCEPAEST